MLRRSVLIPIPAKNIGVKTMYEATVIFFATNWRDFERLQSITPAKKAPVMSATPKNFSAQ